MVTAAAMPLDRIDAAAQAARDCGKARVRPGCPITVNLLEELSIRYDSLAFEGGRDGEVIISAATGGLVPEVGSLLNTQVVICLLAEGERVSRTQDGAFDPPGWTPKIPDISWVSAQRRALARRDGEFPRYWPIAPDFVIEIVSKTDSLAEQLEKMAGWIEHGSLLGLVVDPPNETVYVYRPGRPVEEHVSPAEIDCRPEVPGLSLDFASIWRYLATG